ncbi:MAG: helix-turn-helix domain-containing protein, partial [Deltaproteobacteria bacterium]|nr:helix-turn-helix domain-containing protein [Candidatus Zymogenaceae bacterium]
YDPVPEDDPLWVAYSRKKDAFVDEMLGEDEASEGPKADLRSRQIDQRDRAIALLARAERKSHSKLAQDLGMPTGTVSRILSRTKGQD